MGIEDFLTFVLILAILALATLIQRWIARRLDERLPEKPVTGGCSEDDRT